jgi:hypothetical protein
LDLEKLSLPLEVSDKAWKMGIAGAVAGVTALVGAMGLAIKTTFDWAGELDSIGDVMDVTNEQAAAFGFIARKSGVATETFTKGVVILSKGLVKADGSLDTTGKALETWGINVKDANGNLKNTTALMDDISKKYSTFGTQQEKVNFLTEIFGRNGAELVDFFDVLAKEGGMDAVTEKVKAFGLAIDPARYENFTRNLEEIKLIGTGLAVSFTEKLMPSLEGILDWTERFASAAPAEKFGMLADPLKMLFNLTDAFKQGVDETDWAGLSQKLADGINNIDWGLVGLYVRQGVKNVLEGIETVVQEIDWQALGDATGNALADLVAGLYGYPDWDALAVDFREGMGIVFSDMKNYALENMMELGEILFNAIVKASAPVLKAWEGLIESLKEKWQSLLNLITAVIASGSTTTPGRNVTGGSESNGGSGGGGRRASGGPVIAGQQYKVSEFFRPETFTPSSNGRVDPMQPAYAMAGMGEDVFIQRFADVIARALRTELQKAGRK